MKKATVEAVIRRDQGCAAPRIDRHAGPCRDEWGNLIARVSIWLMELDHILGRNRSKDPGPDEVVMLCPGHHRGAGAQAGYVWATAHRQELIDWASSS